MGVTTVPTAITAKAVSRARRLRRSMTEGERKLWSELRWFRRWFGVHVRRQAPVGPYVVDFAVHEHRLIIEIDGEHHFRPEGLARDAKRDEWLASQGYRVLRFNTGEVSGSFEGCIEEILDALGLKNPDQDTPTPNPSPQGGGEQAAMRTATAPATLSPAGRGGRDGRALGKSQSDQDAPIPQGRGGQTVIRPATAADLPVCARIVNDYIDETEWLPRTKPREEIAAIFTPELLESRTILVAEASGEIVAYLSMSNGWVAAVYLVPHVRGSGIGKMLIDRAKLECPQGLELTVFEPNGDAKRFYEREGFHEVPERRDDNTEEGVPTLLMRWRNAA